MLSISRASSMAALRGDILSSTNFFAYLSLAVYLTVYDSLSLWYCAKGMVQKPHRNRHFSDSQMSGNGFRGRVSQVRILPGRLFFLSLLALTCRDSFQALGEA